MRTHKSLLFLCTLFALLASLNKTTFAKEPVGPDAQVLKRAGLGSDDAALLKFLRQAADRNEDLEHVESIVKQLGSDHFEEREQAVRRLVALGSAALPHLRTAQKHRDSEVARRARQCVEAIRKAKPVPGLELAVVRALVRRHPEGTTEALLRYLPHAAEELVAEEILFGLDALAGRDKRVMAALVTALDDPAPARRAAAACILGRLGNAGQRAAASKLLADAEPPVRLRAAQGLLAGHDKAALPVLIALLEEASTEVAWQAEELLHWSAGDEAPELTVGAGTPEARSQCRAAWTTWWREHGDRLDLAKVALEPRRPGLVLVWTWDGHGEKRASQVYLCGCDGRPRWELKGLHEYVSDLHLLPGGRLLLAEYTHTARAGPVGRVSERDPHGKVLWEFPGLWESCRRLASGNTFLASRREVLEIDPDGQGVQGCGHDHLSTGGGQRRDDGRVVFLDDRGPDGRGALWELDPATATEVQAALLDTTGRYGQSRVQPLANGHYLIASSNANKVFEVDEAGQTVWQAQLPGPVDAVRLRNANTLVACSNRLVELDAAGKMVWDAIPCGEAGRVRECLGLVRLGFSRPRGADVDLATVPYRIKALKSKDVLIRRQAASDLASLRLKAVPAIAALTEALKDADVKVRCQAAAALEQLGPRAKAAVPALIDAMDEADSNIRNRNYIDALWNIGPAAVPRLIEALTDKRANVRAGAAVALGQLGREDPRCLPALIAARKDDAPVVRRWVIWALGAIDPPSKEAVQALAEALQDQDLKVRGHAASMLFSLATYRRSEGVALSVAIPGLLKAARSDDIHIRCEALRTLGAIGPRDRAVFPTVIEGLGDKEPQVVAMAVFGVRSMGPDARAAVPALVKLLQAKDVKVDPDSLYPRQLAIIALGEMGPAAKEAVPVLIEVFRADSDLGLRHEAVSALTRIGPAADAALPVLLAEAKRGSMDHLQRGAEQYEEGLVHGLVSVGGDKAPALLDEVWRARRQIERDRRPDLVARALESMRHLGEAGHVAIPGLVALVKNRDPETAPLAARVLGEIGPKAKAAIPALRGAVPSNQAELGLRALQALANIEPSNELLVPPLLDALQDDEQAEFHTAAIWALGQIGPKAEAAVPVLIRKLQRPADGLPGRRPRDFEPVPEHLLTGRGWRPLDLDHMSGDLHGCALLALGRIGPGAKAAIPVLTRMMRDKALYLPHRCLAAEALGRVGPAARSAVPDLLAVFKDDEAPPVLRGYAAMALGDIGPEAEGAIPVLLELKSEGDRHVRYAAAKALIQIRR